MADTKKIKIGVKLVSKRKNHKKISTHLLTWLKTACYIISRTKEDREKRKDLKATAARLKYRFFIIKGEMTYVDA